MAAIIKKITTSPTSQMGTDLCIMIEPHAKIDGAPKKSILKIP